MNRFFVLGAMAVLAAPASAQLDHEADDHRFVKWTDLLGQGSTLQLYGFVRADMAFDDSRFNDPQIPGFVQSEDPTAAPSIGAEADDSEFTLHGRLTRLGANLSGGKLDGLGDPMLSGNVEIDFYNSGLGDSDSRAALRMRKAYLDLAWEHWSLRAGQDWDFISPLYPAVNADLVMWGAGNTGDRRPQVRATYKAGNFVSAVGIGLSGAVAGVGVEGGLTSGENSGEPMLAARVGYHAKTAGGAPYQFGVWGHVSSEDYDAISAGSDQSYDSHSVGVDFRVPLGQDVWVLGEAWQGENVDDIRGGIFQGVNGTTGMEIEATGGFVELGVRANEHMTCHLGFSMDDPRDGDLNPGQRAANEVAYAAARWKYGSFHYGLEYLNWTTEYIDFGDGRANRVAGYLAYYF